MCGRAALNHRVSTRILHDDFWSRRLRAVELVIIGKVLEGGSRQKFAESRDRARANARVRKWALEAVMGFKRAAHAHLKGLENFSTPAVLGEDRRDGRTLVDPNASVRMRADEWGQYVATRQGWVTAVVPGPSTLVGRKLPRMSTVVLLRNKRGILTHHWTPLELKALPDVVIAKLAFIVRQIDVQLTIPLQCLTNLICLLPKPGGEGPIVLESVLHVLWSSCHAESIREWDAARARFWDSAVRGCSLQFAIRRRLLQEVGAILGESTASV